MPAFPTVRIANPPTATTGSSWNTGDSCPVPAAAGIGLKPAHYRDLLVERPALGFLEVHAENFMGAGGPPHRYLEALAADYPLSFHGVGLSLGGAAPLDRDQLARWRTLVDRYAPALVSEHVSWTRSDSHALHDLLPLPFTRESLDVLCDHIDEFQNALGCRILIENPSRYLAFRIDEMSETEFLVAAARRTGCGLLLDINNVYVSARNLGLDAAACLGAVPEDLVGEFHLAGHARRDTDLGPVLIDDHGSRVREPVWALYRQTLARIGRRPTLVEWDTDVPALPTLVEQAALADAHARRAIDTRDPEPRNAVAL